jgi:hypothetical protein
MTAAMDYVFCEATGNCVEFGRIFSDENKWGAFTWYQFAELCRRLIFTDYCSIEVLGISLTVAIACCVGRLEAKECEHSYSVQCHAKLHDIYVLKDKFHSVAKTC